MAAAGERPTTLGGVPKTGELYRAVFERSTVPSLICDSAGRVVDANPAYVAMSGRSREELLGLSTIEFIHADDLPGVIAGLDQLLQGAPSVRQRRRHQRVDGSWIVIDVATCLIPDPDDEDSNLVFVQTLGHHPDTVDVDAELLSRQVFQPVGDAACIHDPEGRITFATDSLDSLLGRPEGWMVGRRLTDPELDPVTTDGSPAGDGDDPALIAGRTGVEASATLGLRSGDGGRVWLAIVAGQVQREALPVRTSLRDITELIEAQQEARRLAAMVEEQLSYRANHDDLTGLTARRIVLGKLEDELAAGRSMSVVFVDLDGFKAINDDLGHLAGDDLLIGVADRLRELQPASVMVGRAGGDEFVAVTPNPDDAVAFAAQVKAAVASDEGLVPDSVHKVSASVGVAHSEPGDTRATLLARADRSMYEVKRAARAARGAQPLTRRQVRD